MTEETLSDRELAKRLAAAMQSLAGETPLEEFIASGEDAVEGVSTQKMRKARNTTLQMIEGKTPSASSMYHVEAIVHRNHPSHRVLDNEFAPFKGDFRYLSEQTSTRKRIEETFPAVGRIDLTDLRTYAGTGFVVGKNLVMTNRHVAKEFTKGVGRIKIEMRSMGAEVDFCEEPSAEEADGFTLIEPVIIHPYWDMALFRADLPDIEPLSFSTETYPSLLSRSQDIVVIGYPAHDSRNGQRAQKDIFGNVYEVKRIAPGRITQQQQKISSRWLSTPVAAMCHDASTLGGNSGSVILDVDNGNVAGLHFAGRYLLENYGVPGFELARDPRIVDAGVNFSGELPPHNAALEPYWERYEFDERGSNRKPSHSTISVFTDSQDKKIKGVDMSADKNDVTIEIPLKIQVSLGHPYSYSASYASSDEPDNDWVSSPDYDGNDPDDSFEVADFEVSESKGKGYDPDFLLNEVPIPRLSKKIKKDTFELNGSLLIDYTHFSVCQSKSRRLPRLVAWNIDGGNMKQLSRKGIPFILDRRIPREFQAGNELYRNNDYDRGHVARRADLNWGAMKEAKAANRDSFFFTNMTPQHEKFNQSSEGGLWGELENAIFDDVKIEDLRVSVMAGPIFRKTDVLYRGVQIPEDFWKLIAFHDEDRDEFTVFAYIISQKELVFTERRNIDGFSLYQVSLGKLEKETGLDFDDLAEFDSFDSSNESVRSGGLRNIRDRNECFL